MNINSKVRNLKETFQKGDDNVSITIKRNTGWLGVASKIQIKLNGKRVGSIKAKQQIELEIPEGQSNLQVTQFINKSKQILVKDGDVIEITSTAFYRKMDSLSLPIGFIMGVILIFLIQELIYRLILVAVFLAIILIFQLVFKVFNVKVVTDKTSENS